MRKCLLRPWVRALGSPLLAFGVLGALVLLAGALGASVSWERAVGAPESISTRESSAQQLSLSLGKPATALSLLPLADEESGTQTSSNASTEPDGEEAGSGDAEAVILLSEGGLVESGVEPGSPVDESEPSDGPSRNSGEDEGGVEADEEDEALVLLAAGVYSATLERALGETGDAYRFRILGGQSRARGSGWLPGSSQALRESIASYAPAAIVLVLAPPGENATAEPESVDPVSAAELIDVMNEASAHGARLVIVGLAPAREEGANTQRVAINGYVREQAAKRGDRVSFVNPFSLLAGADGGYTESVATGSGELVRVRDADGYTRAGFGMLAAAVVAVLGQ